MVNSAFKYKIIFSHDGITEEFYSLSEKDMKEIISSLKLACSYGTYKDCDIKHEKIN